MNMMVKPPQGREPYYIEAFSPYEEEFAEFLEMFAFKPAEMPGFDLDFAHEVVKATLVWSLHFAQPDRMSGVIGHNDPEGAAEESLTQFLNQQGLVLSEDQLDYLGQIAYKAYSFYLIAGEDINFAVLPADKLMVPPSPQRPQAGGPHPQSAENAAQP